jgi:hypothetical protein
LAADYRRDCSAAGDGMEAVSRLYGTGTKS